MLRHGKLLPGASIPSCSSEWSCMLGLGFGATTATSEKLSSQIPFRSWGNGARARSRVLESTLRPSNHFPWLHACLDGALYLDDFFT